MTASPDDVPSDYRHIRYIGYDRTGIDWNRKLSKDIQKTLQQVLLRLKDLNDAQYEPFESDDTNEWNSEEKETIARAMNLGMKFQPDPRSLSHALMRCMVCYVMLDRRDGPVTEWGAAVACLFNEKVHMLKATACGCAVFFSIYMPRTHFMLIIFTIRKFSPCIRGRNCGAI